MQLLVSNGPVLGSKVFICANGRRHLLTEADRAANYGLRFPDDVMEVAEADLLALRPGQHVPRLWPSMEIDVPPPGLIGRDLREIAAARLTGTGLEIGALASPYPAPLNCNIIYGDLCTHAELLETYPDEDPADMVIPTVRTAFETLDGINDGSLDFILASHVIEHTRDPIGAIVNAYAKLREGGSLVLVVPDKRRTFDRNRPLTTLEHLISDFHEPSHDRDAAHHHEFHSVAFRTPEFEKTWCWSWETRQPIHYHTWVYETFGDLIDWIVTNAAPFKSTWSHPTLPRDPDDFEFYFTLTK